MQRQDHYFLLAVEIFIDELQEKGQREAASGFFVGYVGGYQEALNDCLYACSLGKNALESHLFMWQSHIAMSENEKGYCQALFDLTEKIDKMLDEDEFFGYDK